MLLQANSERSATDLNMIVSGDAFPILCSVDKPARCLQQSSTVRKNAKWSDEASRLPSRRRDRKKNQNNFSKEPYIFLAKRNKEQIYFLNQDNFNSPTIVSYFKRITFSTSFFCNLFHELITGSPIANGDHMFMQLALTN